MTDDIGSIRMDIKDVVRFLTIDVEIVGVRQYKWRIAIAVKLLQFISWILRVDLSITRGVKLGND